jgi:hypothetical protein
LEFGERIVLGDPTGARRDVDGVSPGIPDDSERRTAWRLSLDIDSISAPVEKEPDLACLVRLEAALVIGSRLPSHANAKRERAVLVSLGDHDLGGLAAVYVHVLRQQPIVSPRLPGQRIAPGSKLGCQPAAPAVLVCHRHPLDCGHDDRVGHEGLECNGHRIEITGCEVGKQATVEVVSVPGEPDERGIPFPELHQLRIEPDEWAVVARECLIPVSRDRPPHRSIRTRI